MLFRSAARKLRGGEIDLPTFTGIAQTEGVRYVVFHKDTLMEESLWNAWKGIRDKFTPIAEDDRAAVYKLW